MKHLKAVSLAIIFLLATNTFAQDPHTKKGLKKVIAQEVIQVASYTYLYVLEDGEKKWLAAPTTEAKIGEIFYYRGGMEMPNFKSTELNRVFDKVVFVSFIVSANEIDIDKGFIDPNAPKQPANTSKKATSARLELNITAVEGSITIGELFKNKTQYDGKEVTIKGEVTKYNASIMGKNWIHLQDGTAYEGQYDLMVTSQETVSIGDVVVLKGIITLDKDLGAGYFYAVILEEAKLQ